MTKDKFWKIIDNARAIVPALEAEPLRESLYKQLLKLSPDELVGFDCAWQEYRRIANSPQLIAAACIINGGTSDDRFDYFKNWLILQGQYVFRQALKEPDALAEFKIPFNDTEWEDCGYTQLIQTLYRQADRVHKGRLPVPVHCLMDEYANISLPKDTFLSALATMRSRAIFCSIIVQNMAQLKAMYKDDWESLVGLCDEFLYLGGTEKETHKYVSELLGKETISTTSYNQSKGRSGSYSINHQQSGRDLMTPDEVRLLDNSKCILFIRGERPVVDFKYNLLKHPNIRYTEDGGAAPYDYTAAGNALEDLPGAPENYELLDMDDFLPAEAAKMKPTIQRIRRPK